MNHLNNNTAIRKALQYACYLLFITYSLQLSSCNTHEHHDKKIFHYNEQSGIASLDPAFAKNQAIVWPVHQLYNTLLEIDSDLILRPSLAKSWEISDNNILITFHLRTDVNFHDDACFSNGKGRRLIADDVVYSFKRIIDKSVASPGAWIFNNRVDSLNAFTAINDSTFQLKLSGAFQPILGILSMQYCSVVPHEAVEKYGNEFRRHPVGTGPFSFVAWEEGQALVLKKNEHYFETDKHGIRLPYLDGIKVSFFDSKATEFLEFRQGRLDFINDIDASFKDEILTKSGNLKKEWEGKLILQKYPYLNIEYLGILVDSTNELVKNSPLRSKKVRQAINYAFDRKKMMLYLRNSIGTAAENGFAPMGLPSFDTAVIGYRYDVAKAKQLLAEAGFPDGKDLPAIKLLTIPIYADLGSYIANELKQTGINVQVETIQKSLLLQQTAKSQALFFRGSWIADYPDAENFLSLFYSKNPAPPNYTRYKNPTYDALYERAIAEKNDSIRYALYQQMDKIIINDAPVVPLWYDMVIHLVQPNIEQFYPNSINLLELRETKKN
ncbi:ABC transporter substrate-binding protein [Ferruginibacter lapsinanis]|uniref:ABC transporter substrate-binding protein n=1 Tax=Ferruginibacter lapsinanis TaxID=563172 RepID=UPI001E33AB79|nr:ABC transporter substrate-binding protein [Ferruginibacter lapsinanis]UEG49358.1 ABC transporter substrate-binding protein [Ferruginibacter lapsinanis]